MIYYQVAIFTLLIFSSAAYKNTTNFWANQLNDSQIHFQAYSGFF